MLLDCANHVFYKHVKDMIPAVDGNSCRLDYKSGFEFRRLIIESALIGKVPYYNDVQRRLGDDEQSSDLVLINHPDILTNA